jgi:hypothetical protein
MKIDDVGTVGVPIERASEVLTFPLMVVLAIVVALIGHLVVR